MNNIKNSPRIVVELRKLLADTYLVYLKAQNCHWNVKGGRFLILHAFFEEIYEELQENVDALAERIRMLDEHTPGSFQEFRALSDVDEIIDHDLDDVEMLTIMRDDYEKLISDIRVSLSAISDTNDEATKDMLTQILASYEKRLWMIKMQLN